MECVKEQNKMKCACTYSTCSRKGMCCACIAYHRTSRELPACYFSPEIEKTYDRSIENYIKNMK